MDETEKIERIPLEHPLPPEIQKMKKDETVCQFCGVSYLIHHEIKELEEKVAKLEKDLAKYEGIEEREIQLKNELQATKLSNEELQKSSAELHARISSLSEEKSAQAIELQAQQQVSKELEEKLATQIANSEKIKLQHSHLRKVLPDFMVKVQQQKSSLQNIQTFVEQRNKIVMECMSQLKTAVENVNVHEKQGADRLHLRISELEKELVDSKRSRSELETALKTTQSEVEKFHDTENQYRQLQQKCEDFSENMKKLQSELDSERSKCRTASSETAQYKELLRSKNHEVEDMSVQIRKRDQISEQTLSKLQRELKQKDAELQVVSRECEILRGKVEEQERKEREIQQKAAMSVGETEELKSVLVRTQEEVEGLKAERELMVTSHQNRIEQLRESFKQKLADSEKWPSKLHESIQRERDKCTTQKKELEGKLKESFTMELEIEKQKHQELLDKYRSDYENQLSQLRNEIRNQNSKHRSQVSQLEREIAEAKQHGNSHESSLRQEIQSLKNIITGLEDRLAKSGNDNDELVASLRAELHEAEQDLSTLKHDAKEFEEKLETSKEEIAFLQETVRQECEERYELTEALSEAKEQLLSLQRPAVGYNSPRPTSASKTFIKSSDPNILNRKSSHGNMSGSTNSPISGSPSGKVSAHNQSAKLSEQNRGSPVGKLLGTNQGGVNRMGSNNVSVGFEGVGMPPTKPVHVKPKEGSVDDSRQRIAAAVRRK